jgi:hypothetical protein
MKTSTFKKGHRCINKHLNQYTNTASSYILDVETQYTIFNIENIVKYNIRRHSLSGWSRNFLPFRSNWIHPFNNGVHVVQTFFLLSSILSTIICPFVLFLLVIALSLLRRNMASWFTVWYLFRRNHDFTVWYLKTFILPSILKPRTKKVNKKTWIIFEAT